MKFTEEVQTIPPLENKRKPAKSKAKNMLSLKITLDIVMLLLLLTFYQKRTISMSFHEIAGLVIFGLFLIHNLLNRRWLQGVTLKLFRKTTNVKTKVSWLVDFLLLLSMTCIIITGLMITKTLPFRLSQFSGAKQLHYFCAAHSIILMGFHLGLHWPLFSGMASKVRWLQTKTARCAGLLLLVICLGFGIYNLTTGSFSRWISGPFTVSVISQGEFKDGDMENMGEHLDFGKMKGDMPQHSSEGAQMGSVSIGSILSVIAQYGSEMIVFAVPAAILLGRKKRMQKTVQSVNISSQ